jgi:uncharacterized membrane protein YhaH (DUF805 family)
MNEIEYRNRLIENIEIINELILKVNKKNKHFYIILLIFFIVIVVLLIIICFYVSQRNKNIYNEVKKKI